MCVKMPALHQADLGHLLYVRIRVLQVKIQYIFQIGVNKLSIDTYQHVEKAIPGFLLWIRRTKEQGQIFRVRLACQQSLEDKASRGYITLNTLLVYVTISNYHMASLPHQLFSSLQWIQVYRANYARE